MGIFLIDASGDLLNPGPEPVTVALEHPYDPGRAIGTLLWRRAPCAPRQRTAGPGATACIMCWTATTGAPVTTVVATWAMARKARCWLMPWPRHCFLSPGADLEPDFRILLADSFFRWKRRLFGRDLKGHFSHEPR